MKSILDRYIDRVLVYANKPEAEAEGIRAELKDHLQQKMEDLAKGGMPREEATLEALRQHGPPRTIGYQLRGGFPWIDIRSYGTARGVIAIGPKAVGVFAFGGVAVGVVACGGFAVGLLSAGGFALGLLFVWAGLGIGGIVNAGMAIGIVAAGGLAIGVVAAGGYGVGAWVPSGWHHANAIRFHADAMSYYTPENVPPVLKSMEWLLNAPVVWMDRYMFTVIFPGYLLFIFVMFCLQYREKKRVQSEDDWLIDG